MAKRMILGLIKGLLVGGVVALVLVKGLGVVSFGAALAYVAAVATGALTGLVAGKPVWARGARIEAGVKAFAGALLAAGAMFVLRTWGDFSLDLSAYAAGVGVVTYRTQRAADATDAVGAKVTNYLVSVLAMNEARAAGAVI